MDTLDRTTFENGMRQLMQRLDKHEAVLNVINESGRDMMQTIPKLEDELLDNQDLCLMLHVSKRTLQRYRSSGMIPYRLLKRKPYYKRSCDSKKKRHTEASTSQGGEHVRLPAF